MILLIGGHQRSGTTLLRDLCDGHPKMSITNEFGNFREQDLSYCSYSLKIFRRFMAVKNKWAFDSSYAYKQKNGFYNFLFTCRFVLKLFQNQQGRVDLDTIECTLKQVFPGASIVGDKWPDYLIQARDLNKKKNVRLLVIYRDCRDVVRSTLEQAQTSWRNMAFSKTMNTAEKVARRWLRAIEFMKKYENNLHTIRYEDLVKNPQREIEKLAELTGVDPSGFPVEIIKGTSIGKYKKELTEEDIETVINVAGLTMERLGYL